MRISTLISLAVLGVISASAAPARSIAETTEAAIPETAVRPVYYNPNFTLATSATLSRGEEVDLILEPEGTPVAYTFKGEGNSSQQGGVWPRTLYGATEIVYGEDNKVYIHTPLGAFSYGFAEGTLSEDGKTITVQLPQAIAQLNNTTLDGVEHYPVFLSVMNNTASEEDRENGLVTYSEIEDPAMNYITYSVDEKGVIAMTYPYQADWGETDQWGTPLNFPEQILSCYAELPKGVYEGGDDMTVGKYWWAYFNINQTFTPLPDDLVYNEIPEDLQWSADWVVRTETQGQTILGAIKDNKVYFKNWSYMIPEAVIVGEIEGNKVTFKDRQCLGISEMLNRYIIFNGVNSETVVNEWGYPQVSYTLSNEDVVMEYDPENLKLTIPEAGKGFILNSLIDDIATYVAYASPVTILFQSVEYLSAAPLDPSNVLFSDYSEWNPVPTFCVNASMALQNVNGALLNANDLSYAIYINGEEEPFIFDAFEYGLDEDMEWLPNTMIIPSQKICGYGDYIQVLFYIEGINSVGVQSRYAAPDGNYYYSGITTLVINEGLQTVDTNRTVASDAMFDMLGRRVENPAPGSVIIKLTRYTDGSVSTSKVIF